ncbi:MAG: tetratricopeptide repeat protein [Deltaproteobacteria bacterium]|nr:tetratricopeptide repeat protein [Deltaproteobacteria bacterium]
MGHVSFRRHRLGLAGSAFAAALLIVPVCAGAEDAKSLYKDGLRAFRAGSQDTAIALFHRSEAADPTYPFPTLALARIYQEIFEQDVRNYEEATQAYERLIKLLRERPPSVAEKPLLQAYYFEGILFLKGGEYARALAALQEFLSLYPDFSNLENVHNAIGIAFYYQEQYDKAVESFRKAIEIKPDYPEARFNLRSVFTRLAVYNEAVANARAWNIEAAFEGVASLKEFAPRYLPGRRLEASLLLKVGKIDEAMAVLSEILALDPKHPLTYGVRVDLAKLLTTRGKQDRAVELLKENLRVFPDAPEKQRQDLVRAIQSLGGAP